MNTFMSLKKQSNTFIADGFLVVPQTNLKFDDMTGAVETFESSKQEKKNIWREWAPKTIDGKKEFNKLLTFRKRPRNSNDLKREIKLLIYIKFYLLDDFSRPSRLRPSKESKVQLYLSTQQWDYNHP